MQIDIEYISNKQTEAIGKGQCILQKQQTNEKKKLKWTMCCCAVASKQNDSTTNKWLNHNNVPNYYYQFEFENCINPI